MVSGALLPATDDAEADLAIFEKLMAIDDEAFLRREFRPGCHDLVTRLHARGEMSGEQAEALFEVRRRIKVGKKSVWETLPFLIADLGSIERKKSGLARIGDTIRTARLEPAMGAEFQLPRSRLRK